MSDTAIREKDMTPLQRTLYQAYCEQWRYRQRAEAAVNRTLGDLKIARAARDGGQRKLEEIHKLLVDHGLAANVARAFPVEPSPELAAGSGGNMLLETL